MAHTAALVKLMDTVDMFLLKYKLPTEDGVLFVQHACDCYRNIMTRHSNAYVTTKIEVGDNGIITMPSDMIGFNGLYVAIGSQLWSFTDDPKMIHTTTGDDDDEVKDGEERGEPISYGYGAKGGINSYNKKIDWGGRRIYLDGVIPDEVVLCYTSTGISLTGDTLIPVETTDVIDAYLFWKKSMFDGSSRHERDGRKKDYMDEVGQLRILNFMPTGDQLKDIFYSTTTQTPQR